MLVIICSVALAAVFVVSGVAKLVDRPGTREAVLGFGVPGRLTPLVAWWLAPAELVTALLVLMLPVVGLVVSVLLLAAFTSAVVVAMHAGRPPACHCFGRIGGADISLRTVARNGLLALVAVVGLVASTRDHDPGVGRAMLGAVFGLALAAVVLVAEGLAGRAALRRREHADERAFDLAAERPAAERPTMPEVHLETLAGGTLSRAELLAGGPVLLTFLSPGCGPCAVLRPSVLRWSTAYRDRLQVVVVAEGDAEHNAPLYAEAPELPVLLDDGSIRMAVHGRGTPAAALVGSDGRLLGPTAAGQQLIRRLLAAGLAGETFEPEAEVEPTGAPADSITLDCVVTPRRTVTSFQQEQDTILVDEVSAASLTLNPIGGLVWQLLDGTSYLRDIVADLADVYAAPVELVERDTLELVRSVGRAGLLDGIAAEPLSDSVDEFAPEHVHPSGTGHLYRSGADQPAETR